MKLIDLTINEFDDFAQNHPLRNFCQSSAYAKFMGEQGFNYDYVGYSDDDNNLVAVSLILYKKIGMRAKYAYAPKGFLIDYYNVELLENFTNDIIKKYRSKGVAFLKINPEIIIGEIKPKKSFSGEYNQNFRIIDDLKKLKYKRRRELVPNELIAPRISPYINLKKYDVNKLSDEFQKYINIAKAKGLVFEEATSKEVNEFYEIIKGNANHGINFYRNMLNLFAKNDMAELLMVKVDFNEAIRQSRELYDLELERNNEFNEKIRTDASEENLNQKMASDKLLLELKQSIEDATEGARKNMYQYIGGAIIVKYINRITVIVSGFDANYAHLYPMYYLYSRMIERFKDEYDYLDLNGYIPDAAHDSLQQDLNDFKIGFRPNLYEFIGEFDIIIDDLKFKALQARDLISQELKNQKMN